MLDIEMAEIENVVPGSIRMWRKKHGLRRNAKKYETTEQQREIVNSFMTDLLILADRAKTKLDQDAISRFMLAWVEL